MVWANKLFVVAPRGTGKTEEIQAVRAIECVNAMPRAKGGILAISYKKLKTQLVPPLLSSWKRLGYQRGVHFWIDGEQRPKGWKIEKPIIEPTDYRDFIHFQNGFGFHLMSQDREGLSAGLTLQCLHADEVRHMNKERFDQEASATIRGLAPEFEHLHQYCSYTMTTDMPVTDEAMWILDMEKEMDPELIDFIYGLKIRYEENLDSIEVLEIEEIHSGKSRKSAIKKIAAENRELDYMMKELRKEAVHYEEVADGSNLLFLGKKFIANQFRTMPLHVFGPSIVGVRPVNSGIKFYPLFNVNKHGYFRSNTTYLETMDFSAEGAVNDCRTDGDLSDSKPIHIAFDHNASINWIGVAQMQGKTHKTLWSAFVLGREYKRLKDLLQEFIDYYFFHPNRSVVYHYDHTSIGTDASSDKSFKDEIIDTLTRNKWNVTEHYVGKAPFHDHKFKTIRNIHAEDGQEKVISRINRDNNEQLIKVLGLTNGRVLEDKWQKDKTKEKQVKLFAQEDAPHGSDMYDLLLLGTLTYTNNPFDHF